MEKLLIETDNIHPSQSNLVRVSSNDVTELNYEYLNDTYDDPLPYVIASQTNNGSVIDLIIYGTGEVVSILFFFLCFSF